MGNFEKLSVVVIVVIIVMILVVALYTWTDSPQSGTTVADKPTTPAVADIPVPPPSALPPPVVGPGAKPTLDFDKPGLGTDGLPAVVPPGGTPLAATMPEEPKPEPKTHKVVSGDTLGKISQKYYGSSKYVGEIQKANPDVNAMALRLGTMLTIPDLSGLKAAKAEADAASEVKDAVKGVNDGVLAVASMKPGAIYTVKRGDKLPDIARRTYGSIDRWPDVWLENYDKIEDPDTLIPGTRLKLPR
jgi:nucleoid-associated protein YgaU